MAAAAAEELILFCFIDDTPENSNCWISIPPAGRFYGEVIAHPEDPIQAYQEILDSVRESVLSGGWPPTSQFKAKSPPWETTARVKLCCSLDSEHPPAPVYKISVTTKHPELSTQIYAILPPEFSASESETYLAKVVLRHIPKGEVKQLVATPLVPPGPTFSWPRSQ